MELVGLIVASRAVARAILTQASFSFIRRGAPGLCWRKSIMAERGTSSPRCLSPLEGDGEQIQAILALYRFLGWDEA